jgi:hypothetical protein
MLRADFLDSDSFFANGMESDAEQAVASVSMRDIGATSATPRTVELRRRDVIVRLS